MSPKIGDNIGDADGESDDAGSYLEINADENFMQKVDFITAHNNWVMRNAVVKTHAAREKMFRDSDVSKSTRGAYSGTIHYAWDGTPGTYLAPRNSSYSDFTGGTWEYSKLFTHTDTDGMYICITGTHTTEETATAFTKVSLPQIYLASRNEQKADTNVDVSDQPAAFSVLRNIFAKKATSQLDDVLEEATDVQDNPPYDLDDDGDWCETNLAASCWIARTQALQQTVVVDVPFGILNIRNTNVYLDAGQSHLTSLLDYSVQVLDIFPMGAF